MNDSPRYRANAADCLSAAQDPQRACDRDFRLSLAVSWLLLARQDEAMDNLLAGWDAEPVTDLVWGAVSDPFVSRGRLLTCGGQFGAV
jgi:hypothetical protein